jgi:hypothetical protein
MDGTSHAPSSRSRGRYISLKCMECARPLSVRLETTKSRSELPPSYVRSADAVYSTWRGSAHDRQTGVGGDHKV